MTIGEHLRRQIRTCNRIKWAGLLVLLLVTFQQVDLRHSSIVTYSWMAAVIVPWLAIQIAFGKRVRMVDLSCPDAPVELWNLSVHGIYRAPSGSVGTVPILPEASDLPEQQQVEVVLHPKYKLPAPCFAYVPDASRPATWKLPYLLSDGAVDPKRLPMAIQAILGNYRGTRVGGIPEADMQAVLIRLARAAWSEGRMPPRALAPAPAYQQLALVLEQLGLSEQMMRDDSGN